MFGLLLLQPRILSLPTEVLSTPMGQALRPLMDHLQGQLGNITEQPVPSVAERPTASERPSQTVCFEYVLVTLSTIKCRK